MKEFIILCAKVALGILIGFTLIYGGTNSISKKSEGVQGKINTQIETIKFTSTP